MVVGGAVDTALRPSGAELRRKEANVRLCACEKTPAYSLAVGKGFVLEHKGQYHDAIKIKRKRVELMLTEAGSGGIAPPTLAAAGRLARRAKGRGAVDRTIYGTARMSTKSFFVHHMQQLGKAASIGDAHAINEQAIKLRACLHGSATARATATHASGERP